MTGRDARMALQPVIETLRGAGFWAYPLFGEDGEWLVACDTEAGRVDVRIGQDGYRVDVWDVSPGLFFDEEDERRRLAKERLARMTVPRLAEMLRRAPLDPVERLFTDAWWDDQEHGVGVRLQLEVPFSAGPVLPDVVNALLARLNELLEELERRLLD